MSALRELASADLFVLVQELKQKLEGKRLNNFYDLGSGSFRLDFEEGASMYVLLNRCFNETKFKEQAESASEFAISVRKKIKGMRLEGIKQHGLDRVVILSFAGVEKHLLIFEMFAKGNVILADKSLNIEQAYARRRFKDRVIEPGSRYLFPESLSLSFSEIEQDKLEEVLKQQVAQQKAKLISALGAFVNFGPIYLEDLLRNSGIDPNADASIALAEGTKIAKAILEFKNCLQKPEPLAYTKSGSFVDFAICPISKYSGYEAIKFASMSELLDAVYAEERVASKDTEKEKELQEIDKSIEAQKKLAQEYKEKALLYRSIANKIFEHIADLNEAIGRVRSGSDKAEAGSIKVIKISRKDKTMHVVIE